MPLACSTRRTSRKTPTSAWTYSSGVGSLPISRCLSAWPAGRYARSPQLIGRAGHHTVNRARPNLLELVSHVPDENHRAALVTYTAVARYVMLRCMKDTDVSYLAGRHQPKTASSSWASKIKVCPGGINCGDPIFRLE